MMNVFIPFHPPWKIPSAIYYSTGINALDLKLASNHLTNKISEVRITLFSQHVPSKAEYTIKTGVKTLWYTQVNIFEVNCLMDSLSDKECTY